MGQVLLILLILAVAGGFISYLGDRLGSKIGKKRLSVFGLRPRDTATLLTIVSGALIAVCTMLAVIGINTNFRRALVHGAQIRQQNIQLQTQLNASKNRLNEIQSMLNDANAKQAAAVSKEQAAEKLTSQAQVKLATTKSSLGQSRQQLEIQQGKLQKAVADLLTERISLNETRKGLLKETQALNAATQTVHSQEKHVASLVNRSSALEASISTLTAQNNDLVTQHGFLVKQPVIYRKGQELGRTVISTSQSFSAIRNELASFMESLSDQAVAIGGKAGANGRAVVFMPPGSTEQSNLNAANLSEDLYMDGLAHFMQNASNSTDSALIVATSFFNTVKGEQCPIQLRLVRNSLVFSNGQLIASTTVDGTQPEDLVEGSILLFLTKAVRPIAIAKGIVPRIDPETGELLLGEATNSAQTLVLVKQIQSYGANAVLSAYAGSDTYRSGPLQLRLTAAPPSEATKSTTPSGGQ